MSSSIADRFDEFFFGVNGVLPFPWQRRLVARVIHGSGWPQALVLPTASGKTSCLEIAVFALANEAQLSPADRKAPRRVFFYRRPARHSRRSLRPGRQASREAA